MSNVYIADIASHNSDGKSTGHYYAVASNYVSMMPCKIVGGPIYLNKYDENQVCLLPYDTIAEENLIKKKWKQLKNCHALFNIAKDGTIILQQAALATAIIGIVLFKKKECKLYLITYNNEGCNSIFKKIWYKLAKRKINGVICPNKEIGKSYGVPYCVVPDYIYCGDKELSKDYEFNDKFYDFCVVGRISPEKGVIEVARLLSGTNYKVLIAGKPQNKELAQKLYEICDNSPNIILKMEYVHDTEYYQYIRKSKYCILNYTGEYSERSSGVVFDIIFNNTPVVGKRCKALRFIEENEVGFIFDNIETCDFTSFMDISLYKKYIANIAAYRNTHHHYIHQLKSFLNT